MRETAERTGVARPAAEADVAQDDAAQDDASTRRRVLESIMQHGPSTATELAGRLKLTPAAIRRHLALLVEHGELSSREQRVYGHRGRGRPAKDFILTDAGRASFHQAYDDLAIAALAQLIRTGGNDALEQFARTRIARVGARYHEIRAASPERGAVEVLAEALSDAGYVASIKPAMAGEQLCQHHCPVAHVAQQFPQLCEAETELFSQLLGVHVQRLATIAHGDGVCTTHIPFPLIDPPTGAPRLPVIPTDTRKRA